MTNLRILSLVRPGGDGYYPQLEVQIGESRIYNLIFEMGGVRLRAVKPEVDRAVTTEDFARIQSLDSVFLDLLAKVKVTVHECEAVCNAEGDKALIHEPKPQTD